MEDLYRLVQDVIDLAKGPDRIDAEKRTNVDVLPITLLGRSGRLLRGLLELHREGLCGCGGDAIARAIFETTTYAIWVIVNPERTKDVIRDGNNNMRILAETGDSDDLALYQDAIRRWNVAYPGEDPAARGPSFEQVLRECPEPLPSWYPRYRRLSALVHPGTRTVDVEYTLGASGGLDRNPLHHDPLGGALLAFSAIQVWNLVITLHDDGGFVPGPGVEVLGPRLNELLEAGEG